MIKLYLSCAIVFSCSVTTKAQETTVPVKNKSNRIILHFRDTAGSFTQLAKTLIDRGYEIESKDRELGILKTKVRVLPGGWSHNIQIKSIFRDSTVTFSATQPGDFSFDIFYLTRNNSTFYQSWNELIFLANELKPKSITYSEVK